MAGKKSFFEKLGLVESQDQEVSYTEMSPTKFTGVQQTNDSIQEFSIEPATLSEDEDFLTVEEIYSKYDLTDVSRSIFKVDEFSKVLPDNLPTEVKRQTVTGILAASQLQVSDLVSDAESRLEALQAVKLATSEQTAGVVAENEAKIAELLQQVDELKQQNNDRQAAQEKQEEIIVGEAERIAKIVKFISPAQNN